MPLSDHAMKQHAELEQSPIVANNAMNRKRQARGDNSYAKDVGLDPIQWLLERRKTAGQPLRWLDLCCGEGRALLQASTCLPPAFELVGLDLVGMFAPELEARSVRLVVDSIHAWQPEAAFDLITCVHGLHYLGDKIGVLERIASWLTAEGCFVANFDPASIVDESGASLGRQLSRSLRDAPGVTYDARKKRVRMEGNRTFRLPFEYLGARDNAGPNYTGQPAVESVYRIR